ncbi:MAG TPA: hypothetical protein VFR68_09950 [Candidatus Dormibacteraeota bacterium]|nr:hypothetical protein [Candidatus Dormibacteraeota bacterium]
MIRLQPTPDRDVEGVRQVPYDLVKELAIALGVVLVLITVLAIRLSSPDLPSATIQNWAQQDPVDFLTTANDELAGQSLTAQYGPPYNQGSGSVQSVGPISPQAWLGVHLKVRQPQDFVVNPLKRGAIDDAAVQGAVQAWEAASAATQQAWHDSYAKALAGATVDGPSVNLPSTNGGPVPLMLARLLDIAKAGGLDNLLLTNGSVYQTDYTKPLLFFSDGQYLSGLAQKQHLLGSMWGIMNESGQYPGQAWLLPYTIWYEIPPFNTAPNVDLLAVIMTSLLAFVLFALPFIPGLRDVPRWIPVYRIIWRRYYLESGTPSPGRIPLDSAS